MEKAAVGLLEKCEKILEANKMETTKKSAVKKAASKEELTGTQLRISEVSDAMKDLLLYKNKMYGDSAINPLRVFTAHLHDANLPDNVIEICVRLDDKLSRVKNAGELRFNDVEDIIGYCTLLLIGLGAKPTDIAKSKD